MWERIEERTPTQNAKQNAATKRKNARTQDARTQETYTPAFHKNCFLYSINSIATVRGSKFGQQRTNNEPATIPPGTNLNN